MSAATVVPFIVCAAFFVGCPTGWTGLALWYETRWGERLAIFSVVWMAVCLITAGVAAAVLP